MDKSKIEQAKEGIRWFLEHNNPLPYHEEGLQTALSCLDELTKVRGELENLKQKLALIVSNPETATGNIMAKILENKDLKIDELQSELSRATKVISELPSIKEIAETIYYAENPHFKNYPETSWANYPSEDKGGYIRIATAIHSRIRKE